MHDGAQEYLPIFQHFFFVGGALNLSLGAPKPKHNLPKLESAATELAVARLERWSTENGLRFSTTKTVAVHFCRRRCSDPHLRIRLYGQSLPTEPTAKFLGVLFDRRLT